MPSVDSHVPAAPAVLPPAYPDRAAWGTASKLRAWQAEALQLYLDKQPKDFLAVATPGAGKTTFALTVAAELLHRRVIDRITVVTPTEHLKVQWAEAADRAGIAIDPTFSGGKGRTNKDFQGVAVTYAGVAVNPLAFRVRTERFRTLVILDEVHHGGDALSWGEGIREAFDPATRRLALTGTPFRSDDNPIPFVTYEHGHDGAARSRADYVYGYGHALRDHVVRPVIFMSYSGEMRWRTKAGDEVAARLGEPLTKDLTAQALRTALDPTGEWMPAVLAAADKRLTEVRRHMPDAGGLVISGDQNTARAYAKVLRELTGEAPTVVLSDEKAASKKIGAFSEGEQRWMVAVRMVSEGVDVPRLAVGVYATPTSTPLFFAQAVGRFVRARKRGETASVFVPSVTRLLSFAAEMEVERDHVLGRKNSNEDGDIFALEDDLLEEGERGRGRQRRPGGQVRGARVGRDLRPGGLRRRRLRDRWGHRVRRGAGLPRAARVAGAGPGPRAAAEAAGEVARAAEEVAAGRGSSRTRRRPSSPPTSRSRCCGVSSTDWSPPGTTGPGSHTA